MMWQIRGLQLESKDGRDAGWREGRLGWRGSDQDEMGREVAMWRIGVG
jgi:hypothetical protein